MKARSNLVVLGGIHGVGKSTFAYDLASGLGGVTMSASQLIREARSGKVTWTMEKCVSDIEENQRLLVAAVARRVRNGKPLVLDGHYVLKNAEGEIERIAVAVFKALEPRLLVVLTDRLESIAARLAQRDGVSHSTRALEAMQACEVAHARYIGKELAVEVLEVAVEDQDGAVGRIRSTLGVDKRGA